VREYRGQLSDREDEDEVEEQLKRGDALDHIRSGRCHAAKVLSAFELAADGVNVQRMTQYGCVDGNTGLVLPFRGFRGG
jgi:hypothetical protein